MFFRAQNPRQGEQIISATLEPVRQRRADRGISTTSECPPASCIHVRDLRFPPKLISFSNSLIVSMTASKEGTSP